MTMPKLKEAIGRLFELLKQEGIDPQEHLGADSIDDYVANTSTLAQAFERTFFGRSMPMMYAFPTDLSVYLAEVAEGSFSEVFERRLIGPWIHELSHLARNRIRIKIAHNLSPDELTHVCTPAGPV